MPNAADKMNPDSTPHASLGNDEADHAGACFSSPKTVFSPDELTKNLLEKGLVAPDESRLRGAIEVYGYYHLKGFWLTFLKDGRFKPGTMLSDVLEIEAFNRDVSEYLFAAMGPIEIALRSQITTQVGLRYGPQALHDAGAFKKREDFEKLQETLSRETRQALASKKPLAIHNIREYGQLPIWAEAENISFGTLSKIYENLFSTEISDSIAHVFGITRFHMKSWLRYLTQIRNICAHDDRLYNRIFCILPKMFKEHAGIDNARLFPVFIVLFRLYDSLDPARANLLRQQLGRIVDSHPTVDLRPVGFPKNWREVLRIPDPAEHDLVRPRGRKGGRPHKDAAVVEQALYLYDMREAPVAMIAKQCGISLGTLYKYIHQREAADKERFDYAVVELPSK